MPSDSGLSSATPIHHLSQADLLALIREEPDLCLIDVRTPQEYLGLGHIPNSTLIPIDELPRHLGQLNPNQRTVLICEHGVRSLMASEFLAYKGFQHIYNLSAGMADWTGPRQFNPIHS